MSVVVIAIVAALAVGVALIQERFASFRVTKKRNEIRPPARAGGEPRGPLASGFSSLVQLGELPLYIRERLGISWTQTLVNPRRHQQVPSRFS